jgi:tetratricopeptide (TPR) repeat protein
MRDLYSQHLPILEAERLAESYYYDIIQHFIKSKLIPHHIREKTTSYLQKIQPYLSQYNTINLNLYGRLIQLFDYLCKYEYQKVINTADDAILFFKQKGFMPETFNTLFLHHKAKAQLQLGQYEEGLKYIRMSLDSESIGTHNWFNRGFTMMKLYLFTEKYQSAWQLFKALIDNMDNQKQVEVLMEEFRIYEAFMQFLVATKRIQLGLEADDVFFVRPYDRTKFNKSLSILSKDRMGMNISVQIVQLLHTLIEQSKKNRTRDMENEIMEHIASLEYYRNTYFKKSENTRHDLFVKLINQAVKGHFRTKRIHRQSQDELEALRTQKGEGDIYADMGSEIFKHETVWAFMGQYWD